MSRPANKETPRKAFAKAGPGRPKGSQNRVTVEARAAIEATFHDLGGTDSLTAWALGNLDDFYGKVWVKILPKNVDLTSKGESLLPLAERRARIIEILNAAKLRLAK